VQTGESGEPLRLRLDGLWQDAALVRRPWRIDQHWWRGEPVSRVYYRLATGERPPLTIYHDLISRQWFRQEY
jgi:hypothetical protein